MTGSCLYRAPVRGLPHEAGHGSECSRVAQMELLQVSLSVDVLQWSAMKAECKVCRYPRAGQARSPLHLDNRVAVLKNSSGVLNDAIMNT